MSGTRVLDSSLNLLPLCVGASFGVGGAPADPFHARGHDHASYEYPFAVAVDAAARGAGGPAVGFASGLGCGGEGLVGGNRGWAVHVKGGGQSGGTRDESVRGDADLLVGIL